MTTTVHAAAPADVSLLENLFQLYCYDFADMLALNVGEDGRFPAPPLERYWQDPWRYPKVLRFDERPVGFALIHRRSRITGDPDTWDVAEFFVLRQYRRRGVGAYAAFHLFDEFRGRWEVRQIHANVAATSFWRAVIGRHTGGRFLESIYDDDRWRGPVQTFDNTLTA